MNPAHILCIGKDSGLLRSRCGVLEHAGYDAQAVMFHDAGSLLWSEKFDLIILSAILNDEERAYISQLVGPATPILTLKKLIFASELLSAVDRQLQHEKLKSWA
jgi:hypothetical protein